MIERRADAKRDNGIMPLSLVLKDFFCRYCLSCSRSMRMPRGLLAQTLTAIKALVAAVRTKLSKMINIFIFFIQSCKTVQNHRLILILIVGRNIYKGEMGVFFSIKS